MLTVGLTGGIGSGKTTVSNLFENLDIPVIDTDVIARDLVDNDPYVLEEIIAAFGDGIVLGNGTLDRKKLARIVFKDGKKKSLLEHILHPRIRNEVKKQLQRLKSDITPPGYVIVVIPLLVETGFTDLIDRILVITSDVDIRIQRIMQRDHRSIDEIRCIIDSQVTDDERINKADDVIKNNNNFNELEAKVQLLHKQYTELSIAASKNS